MALALVGAPITGIFGDVNAQVVARYQPVKFAAMEGLFKTTTGAPETLLGWPDPATGQTYFAIQIPKLDSWLAFRDFNARVLGLNAFPPNPWPPPPPIPTVPLSFATMAGTAPLASSSAPL